MQLKAGSESVTAGRFAAYTVATSVAVTITAATPGLSLWYKRVGGAKVVLASVNDLATEDAAYNAQGIKVIGGPIHRIDLPDAAFAAGATQVEIGGEATSIEIVGQTIDLIGQATTAATTDSAQTAAAAAITAVNLDHLMKVPTTLDQRTIIESGTGLAYILSVSGDMSEHNCTTDNLRAVGSSFTSMQGIGFDTGIDSLRAIRANIGTAGAGLTEAGGTGDHLTAIPISGGLTAQQTRDAMKLAPTSGEPAVESIDKHLDDILEDTGTTLPAAIAAIDVGSGTGSNTIQFEITNGDGTLLENATIALRLNDILKATGDTLATGRLASTGLAVAATGTYELSVTCDGYNGHTASLVVTAGVNTMVEVELAALGDSIPAETDPAKTTAYWYVYGSDSELVGLNDVSITIEIIDFPADRGRAYDDTPATKASSAAGLISASLFKGAKYKVVLSDDREWVVEVPMTAGSTYRMPPIRVVSS